MAPKRKYIGKKTQQKANKKTRGAASPEDVKSKAEELSKIDSYCEELGIDLERGGSDAMFQWLSCSIIFGNRLSEKTTIRAAKGLLHSGFTDPASVKNADIEEKIAALNSEGNVQRGPSMSARLEATAALLLEKYDGSLEKLRSAAGRDSKEEQKLIKEFKGFGEVAVNIFCREAQLAWEELFPFADERTLEMAAKHGLPSGSAEELADFVDNDRGKFVKLLAAVVKAELRGINAVDESGKETDVAGGNGATAYSKKKVSKALDEGDDTLEEEEAAPEEERTEVSRPQDAADADKEAGAPQEKD